MKITAADLYTLSNGTVKVQVSRSFGPRILFYGFENGENLLNDDCDLVIPTTLGEWKAHGGHRLWTSPEISPRSYAPDNEPVEIQELSERTIRILPPKEVSTGIQKEIKLTLDDQGSRLILHHQLTNLNLWDIETGLWCITMMQPGGEIILPQEPYRSWEEYLLPARAMVLWHYTDLSDPRWKISAKWIELKNIREKKEPQKLGVTNKQGWAAYSKGQELFVKKFAYEEKQNYPDQGCNNEIYTAGPLIELESLGPLQIIPPGGVIEHTEQWELFKLEPGISWDSVLTH
jgi:hypothetical protein